MVSKHILICLTIFISSSIFATGDEQHYLIKGDTLHIQLDKNLKKVFYHQVEAKQTLFGMSQFYGLSVNRLFELNPQIQNKTMSIGEQIMVPLPDRAIDKKVRKKGKGKYVPLCYTVRKKENLFRIARIYFNTSVDDLKAMNRMKDNTLSVGQVLVVGWISIDGIPKSDHILDGDPISEKLSILKPVAEEVAKESSEQAEEFKEEPKVENPMMTSPASKSFVEEKGVAFWNKSMRSGSNTFVLHKTAPVNSIIEIVNPMFDRKVYAKVVGNIPDKAYTDDIILVVSPSVANQLGAMDPKFYVRIKYVK
ncbi:MAG: LysM peptidoglycan-binding domain-containing protein [Bacteroidota bacterium]